jgi:hypothetical protein
MFQFRRFATNVGRLTLRALSHSEIPGSKLVSSSPRLIAAVHVLLRLSTPRHPPYALSSLTIPLRHVSSSHASLELRTTVTSQFWLEHVHYKLNCPCIVCSSRHMTCSNQLLVLSENRGAPSGARNLRDGGAILVELIGIEPTTSGLQSPRSPS